MRDVSFWITGRKLQIVPGIFLKRQGDDTTSERQSDRVNKAREKKTMQMVTPQTPRKPRPDWTAALWCDSHVNESRKGSSDTPGIKVAFTAYPLALHSILFPVNYK